jgi:hypothetical protein
MDKVVSGCDFDEVLLIESTTWDQETMTVTTPFLDNEDAFVREMEEKGFELDITALAEQPPEQARESPVTLSQIMHQISSLQLNLP